MKFLIALILIFLPTLTFASSLTKQEACSYPEGIHAEEVYVLWPGKLVKVDEFLKKWGFIYYFIHTFPDQNSLDEYRANGDDPKIIGGYIRNTGSYLVSFDCSRSKVKFHTNVRSLGGIAYGEFHWVSGNLLSYSLVWANRDPCKTGPDSILDMRTMIPLRIDTFQWIPRSTQEICVGRSMYRNVTDGVIQFDIEEYHRATEESFYSRYQYQINTRKIKKIW